MHEENKEKKNPHTCTTKQKKKFICTKHRFIRIVFANQLKYNEMEFINLVALN
jgi:hypothetical protein